VLVDHVTFSKTGGAGEVASLLASAQRRLGVDAQLVSLVSRDLRREPFAHPEVTFTAAIDEFLVSNHSSPTILSLYRSNLSALNDNDIRQDSIVHLHWLPGVLTHKKIRALLAKGRKVVWTLHDMAPFAGVCHHTFGCDGFLNKCSDCPQVKGVFRGAVEVNLTKKLFNQHEGNLIVVAPTPWLASKARGSAVFKNQRVEVIENPIRPEFFDHEKEKSCNSPTIWDRGTVPEIFSLTAVASDLGNPAKGINDLVKIVRVLKQSSGGFRLGLVGRGGQSFHDPETGISWLGNLTASELAKVTRKTDLLLSASRAESAGLVVREFGAASVPTLALRSGGISDLIESGKSGLLIDKVSDMGDAIQNLASDRAKCASWGGRAAQLAERNKSEVVAQDYLSVYSQIPNPGFSR
jgi:glycosyltransferase involved in cell wall biosynthesis